MTEEQIEQEAEEHSSNVWKKDGLDYIEVCEAVRWENTRDDWKAGAKWMWDQMKEEVAIANRNKDVMFLAYKIVKDELNEKK